MNQKTLADAMVAWATVACGKSTESTAPTQAQCEAAVANWQSAESQKMAEMVSDKALADDSEAVRATARKSFDAYQAEMPQVRARMIAKCVTANWKPAVLQCMHAAQKADASFCEDLMGPIDDLPKIPNVPTAP